jgi:hypothetical protein
MLSLLLAMQVMVGIPEGIRRDLDVACTGWRLAPVTPEVEAEIHTRTPSWPSNLIPGDFNGDGETDAAALVDCKGSVQLVAFLATSAGFSKQVLEKPQPLDPRQFLHLIRREYEHDAIGVEYDAIGGHAWVFRDNRWQSVPR